MNWARAKTLLIILLLIVNVILGGILMIRETQARARESRAKEDLCAILAHNGLTAKPGQIPPTLALTYDIERSSGEGIPTWGNMARGFPVWGLSSGSTHGGMSFAPIIGHWLWDEALPISNKHCYSAGHCLLILTEAWDETGVLEQCEMGFSATLIAPDVMRLRPCWRFVISGREYFVSAA